MRTGHLLFSAVQFMFVVLLLLVGGMFIGLDYAPHLRSSISNFFANHGSGFLFIGLTLLCCGVLLLIGFYSMNRGAYFTLTMQAKVDPKIFESYIQHYWDELFPQAKLATHIILHPSQQLEIFAEIPPLQEDEQEAILEKINRDLSRILSQRLGYTSTYQLKLAVRS